MSSFHHSVNEICVLFEFYATQNDSPLPTFRDNLSAQSSKVAAVQEDCLTTEYGTENFVPKRQERNYLFCEKSQKGSELTE